MALTLAIDNVNFSYGRRKVLDGIAVPNVPQGCVTAVIGPNAAGKSTLFKCVSGILPAEGEILIDGVPVRTMDPAQRRKRLCYLPQDAASNGSLTVFEAVLLARKQTATWRVNEDDVEATGHALAALGIPDLAHRYVNELSGGQRQLVSIAQAFVRNPELLLLDEPTSALDLQHQVEVLDLVHHMT
ncbi:MAG: ABC transporter ATP-binding protein, partial [Gemmataceae bacterium]